MLCTVIENGKIQVDYMKILLIVCTRQYSRRIRWLLKCMYIIFQPQFYFVQILIG